MTCRWMRPLALPALALAALALVAAPAAGQEGPSGAPRTAWGDPDLQGIWSSSGATPMERPDEFQGRERLTDEEVARLRGEIAARNEQLAWRRPAGPRPAATSAPTTTSGWNGACGRTARRCSSIRPTAGSRR